jgi:hypothetical protein
MWSHLLRKRANLKALTSVQEDPSAPFLPAFPYALGRMIVMKRIKAFSQQGEAGLRAFTIRTHWNGQINIRLVSIVSQ